MFEIISSNCDDINRNSKSGDALLLFSKLKVNLALVGGDKDLN